MMAPNLEERWVRAVEQLSESYRQQTELLKSITDIQKQLNDNFITHNADTKKIEDMLCTMGQDLKTSVYTLLKWFAVAIIVMAGAAEALKFL